MKLSTRRMNALKKHLDADARGWTDDMVQAYYERIQKYVIKYRLRTLAAMADWMRTIQAYDSSYEAVFGGNR